MTAKTLFITGASSGLGLHFATVLAGAGADVALAARRLDRVETEAAKLRDAGFTATAVAMDVTDRDGVARVFAEAAPFDVVINNAGHAGEGSALDMDVAAFEAVIDTNLTGVFNMTHVVWTGMRDRKFGRVINISSINGQKGQAGQANYSAAKAGDLGFTKALAQEGARAGITVNAICPGYIGTEMVRAIDEKVLNERIIPQIPVGRLGAPEEIARCVLFLAAQDAGFITGATLSANGGQYFI